MSIKSPCEINSKKTPAEENALTENTLYNQNRYTGYNGTTIQRNNHQNWTTHTVGIRTELKPRVNRITNHTDTGLKSPAVMTVEKVRSIRIALGFKKSRKMKLSQMEELLNKTSKTISDKPDRIIRISNIDFDYAHGRTAERAQRLCALATDGGDSQGYY